MNNLIENLQIFVSITSIVLIVLLTSFTVIYKIRQLFPLKVNCWFCNENSKVPYEKGNAWTCPYCEQYNGFDENGDYNDEVPGQKYNKSVVSNTSSYCEKLDTKLTANGLCAHCNRNQELKINQLASFVPKDEENYDEEIDEYKKQLEQSYQLCQKCQKVLKRRLNKVKTNILGSKLNRIASQGLQVIDQQIKKIANSKPSKQKMYLSYVCFYMIILISVINFVQIIQTVDMSRKRLEQLLPSNVTYGILVAVSYVSALKQTFISIFQYFVKSEMITPSVDYLWNGFEKFTFESFIEMENETKIINNNSIVMQIVGFFMSVALLCMQTSKTMKQFAIVVLWNIVQIVTEVKSEFHFLDQHFAMDLFMVGLSLIVFVGFRNNLHTTDVSYKGGKKLQNLNDSFHRIHSENISDVSDESESEEDISSNYMYSSSPKTISPFSRYKANSILSLNTTISPSKTFTLNHGGGGDRLLGHENVSIPPRRYNSINSLNSHGNNSIISHNTKSNRFCNNNLNNSFAYDNCPCPSESNYYSVRSNHNNTFQQHNPFEDSGNITQLFNTSSHTAQAHPVNVNALNLNSIQLGSNRNGPCSTTSVAAHSTAYMKNPFLSSHNYNMEERSPSSCSMRSSVILAPSRLNSPNFGSGVSQSSWVAGGFWSTSPQKKVLSPPIGQQSTLSMNFCPIVSRTSSQSSGFESQSSSVQFSGGGGCGLNGGEHDSRESSIGDELEKSSVFSEPVAAKLMFHKPAASMRSFYQYGNNRNGHSNLAYPTNNNSKNTTFSLKNLTNNLPPIPKGKLLKNWIDKNNPMMVKGYQRMD